MLPNDPEAPGRLGRERARRPRRAAAPESHPVRRAFHHACFGAIAGLARDMRIGLRSLTRSKGLSLTVVITLALGIGANTAIFSVVRNVLLEPLTHRDPDHLIYIGQSAPGLGVENMTFSIPEIEDLRERSRTIAKFGDFSTVEFAMSGIGIESRAVRAGVVNGSFFEVMGLRPVLGRLLNEQDGRLDASGAVVLTHRFWTTSLNGDTSVIGKTVRLGPGTATVVGVLEPSVPYPADTEIIANVVTSPHHLGAMMVTGRTHRMTELFGRLAPGASLESARTELRAIHADIMGEHPEAYSARANVTLDVTTLRDRIVSPARTILLVLLASAAVVFVIACSNVANLVLARTVRRESELVVRSALGAGRGALRRALLAESLILCGAGAVLGLLMAQPLVAIVARYASRFSVRALDAGVDAGLLWVGAALAVAAAVFLALVPRLPSTLASSGRRAPGGDARMTPGANRRLRAFATIQVALSFVLLAGAAMLLTTLLALQTARSGYNLRQVLVFDIPPPTTGFGFEEVVDLSFEATRRIGELPGVEGVAASSFAPWRDAGSFPHFQFLVEGYTPRDGEEPPHARIRMVTPGFFPTLGVPLLYGRDFTDEDRAGNEPVVIVSESIARQLFPNHDALNRQLHWTETGPPFCSAQPCRIVGVVADVDDENVIPGPALTVYHPMRQAGVPGRLFVHASGDPYALVPQVTRIIRGISADQPVERAATLADVRAEVLAPDRLNAFVVSGFAGIALLIAAVGIAGVLMFTASARTREFGVRLAMGATRRDIVMRVLHDGTVIVGLGIVAGAAGGYAFASLLNSIVGDVRLPGALPLVVSATVLVAAGLLASLMPAARASNVEVVEALGSD